MDVTYNNFSSVNFNQGIPAYSKSRARQFRYSHCRGRLMATANVSEDGKQITFTTFQQLYCSPDLTAGIQGQLTFISILNAFLSITAFLGNTLILVALRNESSLHPPSKLLLTSLATADLCVGLTVEPLVVAFLVTIVNEQWNTCRYIYEVASTTGFILGAVSLWILNAISLDRLQALLSGLRYRHVAALPDRKSVV